MATPDCSSCCGRAFRRAFQRLLVSVVYVVGKRAGRAKEGVIEGHDGLKDVAPALDGLTTRLITIELDGLVIVVEFVVEGVQQSAEVICLLGI